MYTWQSQWWPVGIRIQYVDDDDDENENDESTSAQKDAKKMNGIRTNKVQSSSNVGSMEEDGKKYMHAHHGRCS